MANGNAILSGLACLAERGKYAEIARETSSWKPLWRKPAKNEKELADYKRGEADRIDKAVARRTGEMQVQIEDLEAKAERKNELLDYLAAIFIRLDELFRKTVKAIIQ